MKFIHDVTMVGKEGYSLVYNNNEKAKEGYSWIYNDGYRLYSQNMYIELME